MLVSCCMILITELWQSASGFRGVDFQSQFTLSFANSATAIAVAEEMGSY